MTAYEKGEKLESDIIEPVGKSYIITGIDYFTRRGYAKLISSRRKENVASFVKKVHEDLKIRKLI